MENPPVFEQPTDLDRFLREAEPTWYKEGGGVRGQPLKVTEMKTQDFQRTPPIAPTSESSSRVEFADADEIVLDTSTALGGDESSHPWIGLIRKNGTIWEWFTEGSLRESIDPLSAITVSGEGTWTTFTNNIIVWIEIEYDDDGDIIEASLESNATFPDAVTVNTDALPYVEFVRKPLFKIEFDDGTPSVVKQSVRQDLRLISGCWQGYPFRYPQEDGGAL